jgi:hypothetical protein
MQLRRSLLVRLLRCRRRRMSNAHTSRTSHPFSTHATNNLYTDIKTVQRHLQANASSRPPSMRTRTQSTTSDHVFPEYHDCIANGEFHAAGGADEYYVACVADGECVVAGDAAGVIGKGSEGGGNSGRHLDVRRTSITKLSDKRFFAILSCPWHSCPLEWRYYATSLLYQIKSRDHIESKVTRTPYSTFTSTKKHFFTSPTNFHHLSVYYLLTYLSFHNHGALRKNPPNILPRPPASPIHHISSPSGPDL